MPHKEVTIHQSWKAVLQEYFDTKEFTDLTEFVKNEYKTKVIYPKANNIFKAFDLTPFDQVKVIVLGQDPYHGPNQAHGLSFSVENGVKLPPSLQNIYKEIEAEFDIKKDFSSGNLENWADQGVFLLNAILTVAAGSPASHQGRGWAEFTDFTISQLSQKRQNLVFMLWGAFARSKKNLIDGEKHLILESPHPSPFSAHTGFFGNDHFKLCNKYLKEKGLSEIQW